MILTVINSTFKQFYSDLYHSEYSPHQYTAMKTFFFFLVAKTLPSISDEQRMVLNVPISKEEAVVALRSLQSGKCGWPIGSEVYKSLSTC